MHKKLVLVSCSNGGCDASWDALHGHLVKCPTCGWIGSFACLNPEEHIKSCANCKLLTEEFEQRCLLDKKAKEY